MPALVAGWQSFSKGVDGPWIESEW